MVRATPKLIVLLVATALAAPVSADSPLAEARREMEEGRRLGWLYNWPAAHPHFQNAERLFKEHGDARNAMLAHVGRLRGEWETLSFPEVSLYLAELLRDPLVRNDPELRLWVLEAKGSADLEIDPGSAQRAWEGVRQLAIKLDEPARASRASGELGVVAFLEGDTATALQLVAKAIASSIIHKDSGAYIRYVSLMGNGLFVLGGHEEAIRYFDRALRTAHSHPDLGTSVMGPHGQGAHPDRAGEVRRSPEIARRRPRPSPPPRTLRQSVRGAPGPGRSPIPSRPT